MQYNSKDSFLANQLKCKNKLKYFQLSRSEFKKLYTFMSNSNLLQIFIKKPKNKTKRNGASFAKAAFCYNVNNNKSLSAKLAGLQSAYKNIWHNIKIKIIYSKATEILHHRVYFFFFKVYL